MKWIEIMNGVREENGYYTLDEMCETICKNNIVFDVTSVLISKKVTLGSDNTIYPGVIIHADEQSDICIGNSNIFFNNTHLDAENGGQITIGNFNIFHDGGISIKCNVKNGRIKFGDHGKYDGRINIFGNCNFGSGSQLLGTINVYDCKLMKGGDFNEPDPDKRAGLLKGMGDARGLVVEMGMVINGRRYFDQDKIEPQSNYHKKL